MAVPGGRGPGAISSCQSIGDTSSSDNDAPAARTARAGAGNVKSGTSHRAAAVSVTAPISAVVALEVATTSCSSTPRYSA